MQHNKTAVSLGGNSRRLLLIVWIFVTIVVTLLAFAYYSLGLMSAMRAYVGGEGLWSKAQKESVLALSRYVEDHRPQDYQAYLDALQVSLGDRQSRLELDKEHPDMQKAINGFQAGRNHPEDIDGMIRLFRLFRGVPELDRAIALWARADALVEELMALGDQIHVAVQAGTLDTEASQGYLSQIEHINMQLTPLEDDFSYALGNLSREAKTILRLMMLLVVSVLVGVAYVVSKRLLRQNERFQQALIDRERRLKNLLQLAPLPIIIIRVSNDTVSYANKRALAQFKVTKSAVHRLKPQDFYVNPKDREHLMEVLRTKGSVRDWEVQFQDTRGQKFWVLISSQRLIFNGQDCLLTALNNINERKQAQEALRHQAFHDHLTGLPNRAMFMDTLSRTLHRMARKQGSFSVLFIDLDNFKGINDTFGHAVGDMLLQEVATRIRQCVREGDLVARLGGDEFVILVEDDGLTEEAMHVAHKVQVALQAEHRIVQHTLLATASIGISSYPKDGTELNTLLRHADSAMYRAKGEGRNNVQSHSMPLH